MCFTDRDLGVIRGFGRVGTDKLFHLVHEIQGGLDEGGEAYWRGQRAGWGLVMVESGRFLLLRMGGGGTPFGGGGKWGGLKTLSPGRGGFFFRGSSPAGGVQGRGRGGGGGVAVVSRGGFPGRGWGGGGTPLWGGAKMAALKTPSPGTAVFSVRSSSQAAVVLLPRAVLSVVLVCLARRPSKEGLM